MKLSSAQIDSIKAKNDILDYASRYVTLKKCAASEYAGPCPVCGGTDRFHVNTKTQRASCRHCHNMEQWLDIIALHQFVTGNDFPTTIQYFGGYNDLPRLPVERRTPVQQPVVWTTAMWQQRVESIVEDCAARLDSDAGRPGQEYLQQRGIEEYTWRMWVLGYTPVSPPYDKTVGKRVGGPALTFPYLTPSDSRIMGIRYRYLKPNESRYINETKSELLLYGLHQLDQRAHTLFIVEGEFNCISIWQAVRDLGVCAVSIGSQSLKAETLNGIRRLSAHYARVICWCDEPEAVRSIYDVARGSAKASMLCSPITRNYPKGMDANDMLRHRILRQFLEDLVQK